MHPCPFCSCHVVRADQRCPHCGERLSSAPRRTAAAAILSLTLVGCVGGGKTSETGTHQVDYGASTVDWSTDTGADADADTDSDTDADTDADADADADTDADVDTSTTGDTGPTTGVDYGSPS